MFWYQSAVRVAAITDGTSTTASFSERCLGTRTSYDLKADFYMKGEDPGTCAGTTAVVSSRYAVPHELSGQRWGDGALFYTRYNHVFPPNRPSCLLGCTTDHGCSVVVSASSRHPGGVNVATVDGAVHFTKDGINPIVWHGLGTRAGGEVVTDNSSY